ncbi:SGT1 protein-domain-containing protein [Stachybotrys elegans]|uniref:SGT1 protein-domain-containing protein n=1 Tax=Stachybotrys elegans TaxID=80388 RepID=A0A8K0SYG2_9HYPO|nr:SGT1 protein-domain-containing protein [Stachybotrys elegans]
MESTSNAKSGFERQLSDNCVEYFLVIIDNHADNRHLLPRLEAVRKAALNLSQTLTRDYIWQRDEFNLELKSENGLTYLHGITDYGDAVEDEWLIVYMLRELSKSYPDLWIRICDTDGEFLLIEAANVLPRWLSPESDQNRVWIHQAQLWLIPAKTDDPSSQSRNLTMAEAVQFIKSQKKALVHSSLIEEEAFYRLAKYPGHITDSIHYSLVTVPRKVAHVLHSVPKSIAPAVEAFYLRDPLSLKPIVSASSPLIFPPEDFVTVSLRFSRVLYAQLKSQRFDAPPRWQPILQRMRDTAPSPDGHSKSLARMETGMMLTCGLEILAASAEKSKSRAVREVAIILDDLKEDGDDALPTDKEIDSWPNVGRDDSEAWMDINYSDFERELEGKAKRGSRGEKTGFGDAQAQDDLRKIVARFESFLNDETAGIDGAELDVMDVDDSDEDSDESSEMEDKEVSFNEEEFSRMMREMMGMPPPTQSQATKQPQEAPSNPTYEEPDSSEEDEDVTELTSQMEAELKEHGALKLDSPKGSRQRLKAKGKEASKGTAGTLEIVEADAESESEDGEIDIDYNLAKNLLESFKSQGGMAGPTGNMLGMMGFQLPRDEDDGTEAGSASSLVSSTSAKSGASSCRASFTMALSDSLAMETTGVILLTYRHLRSIGSAHFVAS